MASSTPTPNPINDSKEAAHSSIVRLNSAIRLYDNYICSHGITVQSEQYCVRLTLYPARSDQDVLLYIPHDDLERASFDVMKDWISQGISKGEWTNKTLERSYVDEDEEMYAGYGWGF